MKRAERRKNSFKKAKRKQYIVHHIYGDTVGWYNNLHQYADNKIHCSCPLCACKTKGRLTKRMAGPAKNWSIQDTKRIQEMSDELNETVNICV